MAQDDLDFQSILEELRKADEIEKQNAQIQEELNEHSESINALEDQTSELLEAAGLEEDDKERNVVGKDKLTATLTSSEKKRYQNIGKEFIEGAGKEFQRILKASKFKSMMSAVKEKFTAGIAKVKRAIKKAKKTSGFLAKLLVIVGLLGSIFYLFKDKITQALPNISQFVKDIFQKAKDFLGGLVEKAFSFLSSGGPILGAGFSVVIGYFKDAIQIFFTQTLPDAIYELYLNVLSLFSSDAEDIKQEFENHPINSNVQEQAVDISDRAEEEADNGATIEDGIAASSRIVEEAGQNLENLSTTQLTNLQAATSTAQFQGLDQNSALVQQLNDLAEGDEDIIKMINDGNVDTRSLFNQIREASKDGELSRQEAFEALKNSIMDESIRERMQIKEVADNIRSVNPQSPNVVIDGERIINQAGNQVSAITQNAQNQTQNQSAALSALTAAAERDGQRHEEINAQLNAQNQRQNTPQNIVGNHVELESFRKVTINANQAIGETLKRALVDLSSAIKNFLSGEDLTKNLVNGIMVVNSNFVNFFNEIRNYATKMFNELANVAQTSFGFYNKLSGLLEAQSEAVREAATRQEEAEEREGQRYLRDFTINVDVNMGSDRPNTQFEFIKDVITIDTTLSKTLEETNQRLSNIVTKIQSGALTSGGDLTVNEEISRVITNNINQTFNQNRLSIVNNVIQKVFADSRMLSAITNTIAEDDDFTEKISKELTTNTDAVQQIVKHVSESDTILENVTNKTVYNDNFINRTTYMFINNPTVSSKLQENVANALSQNEQTIEKVTQNVENNISQSITNHFINNVASIVTNVVNKLSVNETVLTNVNERIARVFQKESVVMAITERIINNPEYMNQFVTNIIENETTHNTLITNVTNEIVNNTLITNAMNEIINDTLITNVTNEIVNNTLITNITNEIINDTLITNVTNEIINKITENQDIVNNINAATTEENFNTIVEQVVQKIEQNMDTYIDNSTNVKVNNTTTTSFNNEYKTSVVTFIDDEGEENTLELVDRKIHDAAINALRSDIRTLANATATNRQQINNNTVQVSKLVGIGNMSVGASDPLPIQPIYALSV